MTNDDGSAQHENALRSFRAETAGIVLVRRPRPRPRSEAIPNRGHHLLITPAAGSFDRPGPAGRQTPSSAARHERHHANFPPRTPENTGPPKVSPRKSPPPSQPSALLSPDRRTAGRRTGEHGGRSRSGTDANQTPQPDDRPQQHRSSAAPPHQLHAVPPHQQHRSRQFFDSRTPQFPLYRQTGRFPALAPNRPKPPIQGFATKSARTARATQSLPPQRFALVLKFSEVAAAPSFLATPQLHRPRSFTSRSCHPTSPAPQASRRRPGATQLRLTLTAFSSFPRSLRMGHPPHPPG